MLKPGTTAVKLIALSIANSLDNSGLTTNSWLPAKQTRS